MDSFEFLEILVSWSRPCFRFMCCFMFLSAANDLLHSGHFTFAWSCWCFFMLVMVQKRSWSFFARPNKAHALAWYGWCCVHSPFVISQVRLGSCLVLAICRVCTIKNFMRILCYVQFVTSEVLNQSTFGLEMFSTVRTQNLFSNVLFVNSLFYYVNVCSCASIETQFHRSVWYFITASEIFLQRQRFKPGFWNFNVASEIFCSVWDMYCRKKQPLQKTLP